MTGGDTVKIMKQNDTAPKEAYKNVAWVMPTPQGGGIIVSEKDGDNVKITYCKSYELSGKEIIVQTKDSSSFFDTSKIGGFKDFKVPVVVFHPNGDVLPYIAEVTQTGNGKKCMLVKHFTYDKNGANEYTQGPKNYSLNQDEKVSHIAISDDKRMFAMVGKSCYFSIDMKTQKKSHKYYLEISPDLKNNLVSVKFKDGKDTEPLEFCTMKKNDKDTTFSFYDITWDELTTKLETPGNPADSFSCNLTSIKNLEKVRDVTPLEKGFFWDSFTLSYQRKDGLFKETTLSQHHVIKEGGLLLIVTAVGVGVYYQFFNEEAAPEDKQASGRRGAKKKKAASKEKKSEAAKEVEEKEASKGKVKA